MSPIDAVIVAHNSADDLRALVACPALRAAFNRIVVVDNASRDGSADVARDAGLTVVERANDGFAAAVNAGIARTDAEFVAILNPDVRVDDAEAIDRLADRFRDPRLGLIAPALRLPDGSIQDSARTVPAPWDLIARRWGDAQRGSVTPDGAAPVPWVVGAFLLLRRRALAAIGGFDERYFLYFEDVDVCVRLRDDGWRVVYDPEVVLRHEHQAASRGGLHSPAARHHMQSALRFFIAHPRYAIGVGNASAATRPHAAVIAWGAHTTRAEEIAASIGATGRRWGRPRQAARAATPARYVLQAARTLGWLAARRPRAVIVQNPPIVAPLVAYAYTRIAGARLVLDSHPTSFGRKGSRLWAAFVPVHRWLARRASLVLVTVDDLADEVQTWGGQASLLHEAPPGDVAADTSANPRRGRPVVLFVGVFADDEPVADVIAAAARLADVADVHVTGDRGLAPAGLIENAPANVRFVGFLDSEAYRRALAEADLVLALTTEPASMIRAAYEAIYAQRPLVVSDWPALRDAFPYAVHVAPQADAIAAGLRAALNDLPKLRASAAQARKAQDERWERQITTLREAIA